MKTAVVILNWNTEGFLRDFLPPLLDSVKDTAGAEVVVADNASEDGSMQLMESSFPDVKTIKFSSNLGFTGGYNEAFRQLDADESPEYLVLINSDIEVSEAGLIPLWIGWTTIRNAGRAPQNCTAGMTGTNSNMQEQREDTLTDTVIRSAAEGS